MPPDPIGLPLARGASGEAVRDLQHRLVAHGHDVTSTEIGVFGATTEAAVRAFQVARGLIADGRCDETTWAALVESGYQLGDRLLYSRRPMLRGDDVAQLQRRLSSLGFDAGRVDGIFGPDTEHAVDEFQRNAGIASDGIFGPDTERAFARLGGRVEQDTMVAGIRERLRVRPPTLEGRRLAIGHPGGLGALCAALQRCLLEQGANAAVLENPDPSALAHEANSFDADAYLGVGFSSDTASCVAYYHTTGFESFGGHQLADCVVSELLQVLEAAPRAAQGMRLPILRETRMPAVQCLFVDPGQIVGLTEEVASGLSRAVHRWSQPPLPA